MRTGLLVVVAIAAVVYAVATTATAYEWDPADPNSPRVKDLGSWAVEEHDRRAHDGLKFVKAVSAESMIKAAVTYRIVLFAQGPDGEDAKYKAEVFVNDEISYRDLRSFSPVAN